MTVPEYIGVFCLLIVLASVLVDVVERWRSS